MQVEGMAGAREASAPWGRPERCWAWEDAGLALSEPGVTAVVGQRAESS